MILLDTTIAHEGGGNISHKRVMSWLKDQLATPHIPKIMHNATYDAGWLRWAGSRFRHDNRYHDSRATTGREPL